MKTRTRHWRTYGTGAALVAGGLLAGGVIAGTQAASATGTSSSTTQDEETDDDSQAQRSDEHLLTGTEQEQVTAVALAEYPGATVDRVEAESDGVYEAHLVTADGQDVDVQVGADLTVTGTETGDQGVSGDGESGDGESGDGESGDGGGGSGDDGPSPSSTTAP